MNNENERSKRKALLQNYYNQAGDSANAMNINSSSFEPELFLNKQIKEKSLAELMDMENETVREVRSLDSEMQTLVYENYNKFISATDTIRKMKTDFKKMEDEMENLVSSMEQITYFNDKINHTFKDRREEMNKLSDINVMLKKLQFLFDLPQKLNKLIDEESKYLQAIKNYTRARKAFNRYKHIHSFKAIDDECQIIIRRLGSILYDRFQSSSSTIDVLIESYDLLIQLGEPIETLCEKYIQRCSSVLNSDLVSLENNVKLSENPIGTQAGMDILEFIDGGCLDFIQNLSQSIQTFNEIFINDTYIQKLNRMISLYWEKYCGVIKHRFEIEGKSTDNAIIVRAIDRFYRKMQSINKQIIQLDLTSEASQMALQVAKMRVDFYLSCVKKEFNETLIDMRQHVATLNSHSSGNSNERKLQSILDRSHKQIVDSIKSALTNLQGFLASDISFSLKTYFNEPFCKKYVRESLVVSFLKYVAQVAQEFSSGLHDPIPSPLFLILTKLCLEFESNTISYLLTLVDEQFFISNKVGITRQKELVDLFHETAKQLLNYYVRVRGVCLSQMIRKSVETRDWLSNIEPRNVRAVMKRIIEDITQIDIQVGELFEEGMKRDKGSDSSRNTYGTRVTQRSAWSYTPSVTADNKLLNNIQKLFAEKIEIFAQVDFSKVSVLTGIIKISLKTFLECIRLKTFSKYGLQQVQVDCYYLQMYLWRFVSDENIVNFLLDEIITSVIHRCNDPLLMDSKIVEMIADSSI